MVRTVVAVSMVFALVGCSVAFQKRPAPHATPPSGCSSSSTLWITDAVVAGAGAAAFTVGAITQPANDGLLAAEYAAGLAGLIYLASAHNGYKWAHECRAQESPPPVAIARSPSP